MGSLNRSRGRIRSKGAIALGTVIVLLAAGVLAAPLLSPGNGAPAPGAPDAQASTPAESTAPAHPSEPLVADGAAPGPSATQAAPDVTIQVDAARGPHGGAPVSIDRRLYGMNIADWEEDDYRPEPNPEFAAYLGALKPGILRWPAGEISQERIWERSRYADSADRLLTADHVDDFIQLARAVKAEPVIAVNTKTGTPYDAASLVHYVNVEKGYGVRWWQIGNEPDLPDGKTDGPVDYARQVAQFERAMRSVDPSIRIVAGELMTGAHIIGSNGKPGWLGPILKRVGPEVDAVSWHYYPLDSDRHTGPAAANVENLLQEEASDWRPSGLTFVDDVFPALHRGLGIYAPGAEVWVTEFGEDPSNGGHENLSATHAGALWTAEVLGRFAAHGTDAMAKFVFKSGSDHNFTLLDEDYQPRPSYYVYWLYANQFGNRMINATSSDKALVNAHAALRDDGRLSVLLVNKDESPHVVDLDVDAFEASPVAESFVVEGDAFDARNVTLNGEALTSETVKPGALSGEAVDLGEDQTVTLPPLSVTMLVLEP